MGILDVIRDFIQRILDSVRAAVLSYRVHQFYRRHICPVIEFALANGSDLSWDDFFHCHVITDENPDARNAAGSIILREQFMLDHYLGLLGHAHEWDEKRSATEDNFNILRRGGEPVEFVGTTEVVYANEHGIPEGPWPGAINFRYCRDGEECPPGTRTIRCPGIERCICAGLRYHWPSDDAALGVSPPD